ncbi:hypothetical protein E2C01_033990 [Portunus trituberculatus]|uniref:Uncharacterized protein n=1 Tax=Portunus trituberculatus TaxID=210409 RepID=A0A5B7F1L9_PORTR|nr:hypothetical protein [Portunus trituberculatus]
MHHLWSSFSMHESRLKSCVPRVSNWVTPIPCSRPYKFRDTDSYLPTPSSKCKIHRDRGTGTDEAQATLGIC